MGQALICFLYVVINSKNYIMKTKLRKYKELIMWIAILPLAALIPIMPANLILLGIQVLCFGLMFYVGWGYE